MSPSQTEIEAAAKAIREILNMPSVSHSARSLAIAALEAAVRIREKAAVLNLAEARKGKR